MNPAEQAAWQRHCPVPLNQDGEQVTLAHGEGGRAMRNFIRQRIISALGIDDAHLMGDAAAVQQIDGPLAFTTDSFVVSPLFFPGGDIGSLAVYGTVNDLAVSGARPLYLSLSLILEEGLPLEIVDRVLISIGKAASVARVQIVTGDTKVVPRGAVDGLFINTSGVGQLIDPIPPGPAALRAGDELIVTGPIGQHGIAVMCAREELLVEPAPTSDSASLVQVAEVLREQLGSRVRAMRDATRGGVTAVLHEWAEASQHTLTIKQADIPVSPSVRGACELLGLDPLHVANEGTMIVAVEQGCTDIALAALHSFPTSSAASRIGTVESPGFAPVTINRTLGPDQPLDEPVGAPLPRIC